MNLRQISVLRTYGSIRYLEHVPLAIGYGRLTNKILASADVSPG